MWFVAVALLRAQVREAAGAYRGAAQPLPAVCARHDRPALAGPRVRTVALHSDWRTHFILEGRAPILRSSAVAAHYMVALPDLDPVVKVLRARADVVAVVPHDEGAVLPLARIAEELQLDWAQPLVQTFRNKGGSSPCSRRGGDARINANVRVTSADEVANWRRARHRQVRPAERRVRQRQCRDPGRRRVRRRGCGLLRIRQ